MEIEIYDNGGETNDRYCLIFDKIKVFTMSADPLSSWGIKYLCDSIDLDLKAAGTSIRIESLPNELLKIIKAFCYTGVFMPDAEQTV